MVRRVGLVLLLILGLIVIFFSNKVVEQFEETFVTTDPRPIIATLESHSGSVSYKLPQTLVYKKTRDGMGLRNLDTVITDANSKAVIKFESGFRVELEPNSIIIIEQPSVGEDGQIRVTFVRGDLRVLDQGAAGKLILSKDDVQQDAAGRAPPPPIKVASTPAPPVATPPPIKQEVIDDIKPIVKATPRPTPPPKKETLPDDYIAQTIRKQTPFFYRCYQEHLRLNPNARGRISLSFTINREGSVSNVRLLGSTLKDPRLEQCTMAVIERTRFRKFDGDPIVVNYPVNFE